MRKIDGCPFCGGDVLLEVRHWQSKIRPERKMNYLTITCNNCNVQMQDLPYKPDTPEELIDEFKEKLIKRWNSRSIIAAILLKKKLKRWKRKFNNDKF